MPTVTLLKPMRLNTRGIIFERGVPTDVSASLARELLNDPRFKVEGVIIPDDDDRPSTPPNAKVKPTDTATLYAEIRAAADQLDIENEENFTASGKPQVTALEKILGYDITAAERDAAMAEVLRRGKVDAEEPAKKGGVRIISKNQAADKEAKDPTTSEAVQV